MQKLAILGAIIFAVIVVAAQRNVRFARYPVVEAYEVRPGIIMMPRYGSDGQVCEIGLEPLRLRGGAFEMGTNPLGKQLAELFDELAPVRERGRRIDELGDTLTSSRNLIEVEKDFENLEITTYNNE